MKGKGDEKSADEKVLKGLGDFGIIIAVSVYSRRGWCRLADCSGRIRRGKGQLRKEIQHEA